MERWLVSGIGTDVGKTVVSAVLSVAWGADYWKPVQTGARSLSGEDDSGDSDRITVHQLTEGSVRCHREVYAFPRPVSPDAAAASAGVTISMAMIAAACPETDGPLIIEGAGGLLVPLSSDAVIADLAPLLGASIVLVSRHYLGSINHTLLSVSYLRSRGLSVAGIVFVGDEHPETERSIQCFTDVPVLGRVPWMERLTPAAIRESATLFASRSSDHH